MAAKKPQSKTSKSRMSAKGTTGQTENLKRKIKDLERELGEVKDGFLRQAAEFENFKKRKNAEFLNIIHSANGDLLKELLPVSDDLDRLSQLDGKKSQFEDLHQGLGLVSQKFRNILRSQGLEEIEAVGQPFDPEVHEALLLQKKKGVKPNRVIEEHQKGYRFRGRILRHTRVVVSQ